MKNYPDIITSEILKQYAHLSNVDLSQDIQDTIGEIVIKTQELDGYRSLAEAQRGTPQGKMAAFHRDARQAQIEDRRDFVTFLNNILVKRLEDPV